MISPSACQPWQPDPVARATQEHRSYTTWWDTTSNRYVLTVPEAAAEAGARLSRAAFRLARKVAAVARALVGKQHQEGEQKINPARAGQGLRSWPAPHAPMRTVAEQLEILAEFRKEEGLRVRKKAGPCLPT